jgi:predicted GNAT family N-acyltransferase
MTDPDTSDCNKPHWPLDKDDLLSRARNEDDEAFDSESTTNGMIAFATYERLIQAARDQFALSPGVQAIRRSTDKALLEAFLLYFSILGSRMTEPVEGWLNRAAERCCALGLTDLARALHGHARAEAGHHLMMISDARSLSLRRPARGLPAVDVEQFLTQATSGGVSRYINVHEENISGETPYAQAAIEYEVEMLPLRFGSAFLRHCLAVLGEDIIPCLTFVTEHIVLDASHTEFNARLITRFLGLRPEALPTLVDAGSAVLEAYAEFLEDCVELARRDVSRLCLLSETRGDDLYFEVHIPPAETDTDDFFPEWLASARELRASIFFENGRRPRFRSENGVLIDNDPIDLYAHHILAYDGPTLIGCVRVYCLDNDEQACVVEQVLGQDAFAKFLAKQQVHRADTVEIGRWAVQPGHRGNGRTATRLAAAAAALAERLCNGRPTAQTMVVCAVGLGDGQDLLLSHIGMTTATCGPPINCEDFNDDVRVMYCVGADCLNTSFRRIMRETVTSVM